MFQCWGFWLSYNWRVFILVSNRPQVCWRHLPQAPVVEIKAPVKEQRSFHSDDARWDSTLKRFTHCRCWEGFQTGPPGLPGEVALGSLCLAFPHTASWQSHRPRLPAGKHTWSRTTVSRQVLGLICWALRQVYLCMFQILSRCVLCRGN